MSDSRDSRDYKSILFGESLPSSDSDDSYFMASEQWLSSNSQSFQSSSESSQSSQSQP